jgi:hypothetical protein
MKCSLAGAASQEGRRLILFDSFEAERGVR